MSVPTTRSGKPVFAHCVAHLLEPVLSPEEMQVWLDARGTKNTLMHLLRNELKIPHPLYKEISALWNQWRGRWTEEKSAEWGSEGSGMSQLDLRKLESELERIHRRRIDLNNAPFERSLSVGHRKQLQELERDEERVRARIEALERKHTKTAQNRAQLQRLLRETGSEQF